MLVKPEGDPNAKIWIIGEAPGAQEDETGRPFVGGAGTVLDGLLRKSWIKRQDCYIDNIIQQRPKDNDFTVFYNDSKLLNPTEELIKAHQRIRKLIETHRPNIVVLLGNESLFAVTGNKGILNWRGSILCYNGVKIIPTLHPALVMRDPSFSPIAEMDFHRIAEESKSPSMPKIYNDNFIVNPTYEECIRYMTEVLPSKEYLTFDIETIPDMEQIMCIGFAWSAQDAVCIPIFYGQSSWWTLEEELGIIKAIRTLMANNNIKWIAQNAQYDMTYILDKWEAKCKLWMDTMTAFHNVYPEMKKSLAFICSIYSKRPYYKEDGGKGKNPTEEWIYNCKDVCVTYEVAFEIRKEMEEFNTLKHYETIPLPLGVPLMDMQSHGILVDVVRRAQLDAELSKQLEELQVRMNAAVDREININSPKQIKELLYDDLGLPPIYGWGKIGGKKAKVLSSDEDAITKLQKLTNNPVLGIILEMRGITKLLGTYVRAELEKSNRICCSYILTGTETGRLSARKSIYGRGTNLQNIPRLNSIRSMFIAEPGYILVNADLSQAEARLVAYQARETRMINVFKSGEDIHVYNAAMIHNKQPKDVLSSERQDAKGSVHGANYRIQYAKLAEITGKSESVAREILNKYKSRFPMLEIWWKEVEEQMSRTRIMTNYFGRKRMFFGRWGHELVNEAIAYYPQSTVGDLLNLGIIRAYPNMPIGWKMLANNHDSVLASVPEDTDHMHIWKFFKHYFEIPLTIHGKTFIVPMDIKTGTNWGNMKDMEEPK